MLEVLWIGHCVIRLPVSWVTLQTWGYGQACITRRTESHRNWRAYTLSERMVQNCTEWLQNL